MKKLLENLKEAIILYEKSVNADSVEHVRVESLLTLSRCCREVDKECQVMFNTIFDDD